MPGQRGRRLGGYSQFVVAPHQSAFAQVGQGGLHVGPGGPVADQVQQFSHRNGEMVGVQDQQSIEQCQVQEVEIVGGEFDRLA